MATVGQWFGIWRGKQKCLGEITQIANQYVLVNICKIDGTPFPGIARPWPIPEAAYDTISEAVKNFPPDPHAE